jgi:ParB family chromosome partitioning protein
MIEHLDIERVFVRQDARKIDEAAVRGLVDSIREVGIINPLRVRQARRMVKGVEDDAYEVTTGAHRLRAARKLAMTTVPCIVIDDDDLHAELAMIDENLCRADLSPAERAKQTARRKAIYLVLHPETAQHVAGANAKHGSASDNLSFAVSTAEAVGRDRRTIERDAERGEKVCDQALSLVKGTDLDTGSYLDKLKKIGPEEQVATVQRALAGRERQRERDRQEREANRNRVRVEADVKQRAAREIAEILVENVHADALDTIKANLAVTDSKSVLIALSSLESGPVMDRDAA